MQKNNKRITRDDRRRQHEEYVRSLMKKKEEPGESNPCFHMKFKTKILQFGNNTGILIPDDKLEKPGGGKSHGAIHHRSKNGGNKDQKNRKSTELADNRINARP